MKKIFLISTMILYSLIIWSAPLKNAKIQITQPNGKVIDCFATGDEYYHWMHDKDNYTIIQDQKTGYFCYASIENDELVPTHLIVGKDLPERDKLNPEINYDSKKIKKISEEKYKLAFKINDQNLKSTTINQTVLNNVLFFVKFAGETEFTSNFNSFSSIYNDTETNSNSCKNYFKTVSRNQFTVNSYFFPSNSGSVVNSYQDQYPRSYYLPYSSINSNGYLSTNEAMKRESDLVWRLVSTYSSSISNVITKIDNICVVYKGIWGMFGGNILWSHFIYYQGTNSNRVNGFVIDKINGYCELDILGTQFGNRAIVHELAHSLGAGDLYKRNSEEMPVGPWDVMSQDSGSKPHLMTSVSLESIGGYFPCFIENLIKYNTIYGTHSIIPISTCTPSGSYNTLLTSIGVDRTFIDFRVPNFFDDWLTQPGVIITKAKGYSNYLEISVELLYNKSQYSIYNAFYSQNVNRTRCAKNTTTQITSSEVIKSITISNNIASFEITRCVGDIVIINNPGFYGDDLWVGNRIETIGNVNCNSNNEFNAKNEILLGGGFQVGLGYSFLAKTGFTGCE
jgi:M6 family metalloprotease-like protein